MSHLALSFGLEVDIKNFLTTSYLAAIPGSPGNPCTNHPEPWSIRGYPSDCAAEYSYAIHLAMGYVLCAFLVGTSFPCLMKSSNAPAGMSFADRAFKSMSYEWIETEGKVSARAGAWTD
ncbi:hypothetical protein K493DRAFT_304091 [Basidiobolus meristosporus CBS 931.73]|uniref:Uncharacterized protein n=1 Tax=Basidiobolus meristosporus CBS 931.73 TaxID=1314790 RepID=A0A1Y1Y066_9FUNG|nr:hypothetical protein K493DRAFT_304091 [Basidiobolus meristosporus CBS 931.73]|eukprot:ORX91400.1 hypothetical protein K493DRAFT_304091 [Basidiobolus meristosporus CBS 931.73]